MIFFKKARIRKLLERRAWLDSYITSLENLPAGKVLSNSGIDSLATHCAERDQIDQELEHLGHCKTVAASILSKFTKKAVKP